MTSDIRSLADDYFEHLTKIEPTDAHLRGDYRYMDRFELLSRTAEDADIARRREIGVRARAIDPTSLEGDDRTTRETLLYEAETSSALLETRVAEFAVDPVFGLQAGLPVAISQMSVETPEHADKMIEKYRAIGVAFDEASVRLREGVANRRTPAEFAVEKTVAQIDALVTTPVEDSAFLRVQTPDSFDEATTAEWKGSLAEAVREAIYPALVRYRDVIRDEVGPVARSDEECGVMWLADGEVIYGRAIHRYTTLPMQPGEIHEVGLQQIDRLADEYRALGSEVLGTSDLGQIFSRLRDDPSLHHTNGADVVAASEAAFARAKAAMGDWFGRLPGTDCMVRETKRGAVAFYFPPAEDGSRPGVFFMNTANPSSWGTYEIESTSFHEGIPGHHLQIAIAQELGDSVPAFRRHNYIGAHAEGWGLYTERLADEMGLYGSDLDRMGMLSADSMRAGRLVVDTGVHALGWSRQRAIDYMADNSPMTLHAIEAEIDRYIAYPGQALSYMIGRLEIQRIRAEAEAALGDRFDIKGFHDAFLEVGGVTLDTAERVVDEWVTSQ